MTIMEHCSYQRNRGICMTETKPTVQKEPNRNPRRGTKRLSSVTTAIHLLKTFTLEDPDLGISDLAKRLGVAKSTVHRLASSLLDEGLLQQSTETGRYSIGIGLFTLGSLVRARLDVTRESRHVLNELREKTGENVRLAVLERQSAVLLHDLESPQNLRLRSATGQLRPAYCSAEGLCLLSGLREPELHKFLEIPREPRNPNTPVSEEELRNSIRMVKRQGYAIEDEICDEGTRAVAAPIFNADGRIVAALGVAGPRTRIRKSQFKKVAKTVVAAADQVSEQLGYLKRQRIYV